MYFEIENTPEHVRKARRAQAVQRSSPKEQCPRLFLAPFTKPPQIVFDDVLIGTTCEKTLEVINPSKQVQQITLGKTLPPGLVIQLPGEWLELEPETCYCVSLLWSPVQPTALRETIRFTNENRGRYDVIVVLKTCHVAKGKPKAKGFKVSPGKIKKKVARKSPVAVYKKKSEIIYNTTQIQKTVSKVVTQSSIQHRILKTSNKENITHMNNYSIDSHTDNCPFGSPNSIINFDTSEIFSNLKQMRNDQDIFQQTFEKPASVNGYKNDLTSTQNILKPSKKQRDNSGTDIFDNLTFTPLKALPGSEKLEKGPKIVLSMNSDSEFDDSLDMKNYNKENETHSIMYVTSSQTSNQWLTVNHQPQDPVEVAQNKKIPNTSSPKELSSPNFSINTEFSRISDLSFFPQRFSTEKKNFPINNDTHEILDKYGSDTFTKDSPNTGIEQLQFHRNEPRPSHNFMKEQNARMCRQSLFKEYQHQRDILDRNYLNIQNCENIAWQNDLRVDMKSPPRSITPPLQSIPEESMQGSDTQILDKTDKQMSTFTINRTFDKTTERNSTINNQQSWSKKAVRAELELWKVPIVQARKSLKPKKRSDSIVNKITNTTFEANKTLEQSMSMSYVGNVYSQSSTVDPFLSSTYYYDEVAVDKFEKEFKRWLNCILTPPADLDCNIEQKIDVGKVWIENRNKEVPVAPTKEQVSSNYHNSHRLESLRRSARALLMSAEIAQVFLKLNVQIEKKLIAIRTDRNLHLDVGLQKAIMEILLSYNPLWLRIGLEAIYGLVLPLRSNSDIEGLTTFIVQRMFKNPHLKNKHSKSNAPNMLLPAYMEAIKKFTLKKFFMLIFFLDQAKQKKLISHDPCLFCRNAICKESREVIIRFTRELIAGIGDITKHLRPLGYVVCHKQSYLDEYKYAVHNIAIDLRDGVRLTKVMEIILIKNGLLNQLRTPAISRLQKIHNVSVALNALKDANFTIVGDITPTDIADGHREKTLSILWQLIHVLRAPLFEKAAHVIQTWWRKKYEVIIEKRKEEERVKQLLSNAASVIQCWWRRKQYNRLVEWQMKQITTATVVVQKYCRMWLCRTRLRKLKTSVIKIEEWYRSMVLMREACKIFQQLKSEKDELRRKSAVIIQSYVRKLRCVKEFKIRIQKIVIVQTLVRTFLVRRRYVQLKKSVFYVQAKYRGKLQMRRDMNNFAEKKRSAIILQSNYRMITQYRVFQKLKHSVKTIEDKYIALIKMRNERSRYLKLKENVIKMQARYRCKATRQYFLKIKNSTVKIQRRFRANQLMKHDKASFVSLRNAAVILQSRFKAQSSMKKAKQDFLNLKKAVIKIQTYFRANQIAKSQKHHYNNIRNSSITIQRWYRATISMRVERTSYLKLISTVTFIQKRWLFMKEYKRKIHNIVCIQSCIRRFLARNRYNKMKGSVVFLQKKYRGKLLMRRDMNHLAEKRRSTIVIQSYYRMWKCHRQFQKLKKSVMAIEERYVALMNMRKEREIYHKLKIITIRIQAQYRCRKTRSIYLKQKEMAIILQRRFRANRLMKQQKASYDCLKNAAAVIQHHFKAHIAMKKARLEYVNLKKVVNLVQTRFRANKTAKSQRDCYLKLRSSTIILQRQYRSLLSMRKDKAYYLNLKRSVKVIEKRWLQVKEYRLMVKKITLVQSVIRRYIVQKRYIELKKTVLFVQEKYRGKMQMRKDIESFEKTRKCAVIIQSYFRMKIQYKMFHRLKQSVRTLEEKYIALTKMRHERKNYLLFKESVIKIQALYRCRTSRRKFLSRKIVTIKLQSRFRANQLKKIDRASFLQLKNATIVIQRRFRALHAMKQARNDYMQLRNAVITVQCRFRANKLAKTRRILYVNLRSSVVTIQTYYRALLSMRKQRMEYLRLKDAVSVIQRRFRAQKIMIECRQSYETLRTAALAIQRRYRAYILMREERSRYLRLKFSCTVIQSSFRTYLLSKRERDNFLRIKHSTILIQSWYRCCIIRQKYRSEFLQTIKSVIKLQAVVRGYLVRREVQSRRENLVKIREEKKKNWAASKIQALFRGHTARMNIASDKRVAELRRRWREGALETTQKSLKERNEEAMEVLTNMSDIETVIQAFRSLELLTEVSPMMYNENASSIVRRVYIYMSVTNRSISSIEVLKSAASVLVNLTRYRITGPKIYERERVSPILKFMWRFSNSETELFCILSTYLWLFSKYAEVHKDLTEFLHIPENHKMLVTIKNNVERMKRMERNKYHTPQASKTVSRTNNQTLNYSLSSSVHQGAPLPALEPDYGIIRADKPRYFEDSHQAITCLFRTYTL